MFDPIGNSVIKLRRSRIGVLRDDDLKPGKWRRLSEPEVKILISNDLATTQNHKTSRALPVTVRLIIEVE